MKQTILIATIFVAAAITTSTIMTTQMALAQMFQTMPGQASPLQQFYKLRQNFAMFEQQLMFMPHQQQQFVISNMQQQIMQDLTRVPSQAIPQAIQLLRQAMSPQLAQAILAPIVTQLQSGAGGGGIGVGPGSFSPPNISSLPQIGGGGIGGGVGSIQSQPNDNSQTGQNLMDACLKSQMPVSNNSPEYCQQILNPNPAKAAGICGYLGQARVPVPGC